jgi:hypothetical protein
MAASTSLSPKPHTRHRWYGMRASSLDCRNTLQYWRPAEQAGHLSCRRPSFARWRYRRTLIAHASDRIDEKVPTALTRAAVALSTSSVVPPAGTHAC